MPALPRSSLFSTDESRSYLARRLSGAVWVMRMLLVGVLLTGCGADGGARGQGATPAPVVDEGSSVTVWAEASTPPLPPVTPGTWRAGGANPANTGFQLIYESDHFAFYSDEAISQADLVNAAQVLEETVWDNLFGATLRMPEPYSDRADKIKAAIHIKSGWGLSAGGWTDTQGLLHIGMWIGPGALRDHWGLAHEFTHGWQSWAASTGGLICDTQRTCGWLYETHANFTPHQLPEYRDNVHCSEMLPNAPHLYLGSLRNNYCNWQFLEFLKDRYSIRAVTDIWTTPGHDPLANIQKSQGWSITQLNDFFGDWAMHNVVWDYRDTPQAFRNTYGDITRTDRPERLRRLMPLEALDDGWATNRRFVVPFHGAPQRFGYNVVRLYPAAGATTVTVRFRGIDQQGSDADFRWGLVATNPQFTSARYSALQRGLDANLTFRVAPDEPLFLVVMATPSVFRSISGDTAYNEIWRYRYMIELADAWPQGFQNGQRDACPTGTARHANGGGCAPAATPSSVYVGPYATILPRGSASGNARIEDQAIIYNGSVTGGVVGGLSVIGSSANAFTVSDSAQVHTSHYPLGFFEPDQKASGSAILIGDVEYRGAGLNRNRGTHSGFVDADSAVRTAADINTKQRPAWRP